MASKKPVLIANIVEEFQKSDGTKGTSWTKVGVAFKHNNGEGFDLLIKPGMSLHGRIVLSPPKPEDEDEG